ncbi:hypothetical protein GLYMA_03G213350v4 [Glycine max]|nr:hypothetical protein GLYMA_03G213350v4 [Glycine max]KAH1071128.1 hypothetical protein GYH30_007939 [Glycine max]
MKQPKFILDLKRIASLIPYSLNSPPTTQRLVCKAINLQYLIIPKIESPIHLLQAPLHRIIPKLPTRLAPHKMSHQWPPMVTKTRVIIFNHLLISINQNPPIAMQVITILKINLTLPLVPLLSQQINHCRLIISFKNRPILKLTREHFPSFISNFPFGPHWSPSIKNIQRPLTIP